MKTCLVAGSFDPITNGHLDIIRRARALFSGVTVGILNNVSKRYMFSRDERLQMVRQAVSTLADVDTVIWDGLLVDLLRLRGIRIIVRGVRNSADLASEQQLAFLNRKLYPGCETILLPADPAVQAVSSSVVRELLAFGADIVPFVPASVLDVINAADKSGRL